MPKLDSLEPLMIEELRDLLDAEKQVSKALPKMARAASSDQLRSAFEEHFEQTSQQLERLNQVFDHLGEKPRGKKCVAMQSLIEEGQHMLDEVEEGPTRDALLIAAAQKVEHYEMAAYGTVRTFANLLGHADAAGLLQQTLDQERETDQRLTHIAESVTNPQAARGGSEIRRQAPHGRSRSAASDSHSGGRNKAQAGHGSGTTRSRASSGSRATTKRRLR